MFKFFRQKSKKGDKRKDAINKDKLFDRNALLSKVAKASEWSQANDKTNYEVIKENLKFLKSDLKLDRLEGEVYYLENNNDHNSLSGWLTARQMTCMATINSSIQEKNVQGAYHELYDFIQSYGDLRDKPIDVVERIIIRNSVIQIEDIFK